MVLQRYVIGFKMFCNLAGFKWRIEDSDLINTVYSAFCKLFGECDQWGAIYSTGGITIVRETVLSIYNYIFYGCPLCVVVH